MTDEPQPDRPRTQRRHCGIGIGSQRRESGFGSATGGTQRRFVAGVLGGAVMLLILVGGVNAYGERYGYAATSRSMKVQPSYLRALTGSPTFNAGVSSAAPQDAWAFVNFLAGKQAIQPPASPDGQVPAPCGGPGCGVPR